jgi:hypothetical protein
MDHHLRVSLELSRLHRQPDSLYSPEVKAFCTEYVCSNIHVVNFISDNCLRLVGGRLKRNTTLGGDAYYLLDCVYVTEQSRTPYYLLPAGCLAYTSTLKMEAVNAFEITSHHRR